MANVTIPGGAADLASACRNLAINCSGEESRQLLELHDQLTDDLVRLIKKQLAAREATYQEAANVIGVAIAYIGDGTKKMDDIAKAVGLINTAAAAIDKLLQTV